jgi:molecular chaperone Hsp33
MLSISSIIGSEMKKADASLTARINGGGPVGTIIVVTDSSGNPRCFVQNPKANLPNEADGSLDVGAIVGKNGVLTVIRDLRGKAPYIGSTELISGEIAEDFAVHFAESEQIRSACALGVLVDEDGSVLAAGGYVAKLLPGAPESAIDLLEENVASTGIVTEFLKKDGGAELLLDSVMNGFAPRVLSRHNVEYKCTCSRERFLSAVLSLSKRELDDMQEKGEPIETSCQFCTAAYKFELDEIFDNA